MTLSVEEYESHDATGLAELVKTGAVSAREVAETAIARIEAINPQVNAVIFKATTRRWPSLTRARTARRSTAFPTSSRICTRRCAACR